MKKLYLLIKFLLIILPLIEGGKSNSSTLLVKSSKSKRENIIINITNSTSSVLLTDDLAQLCNNGLGRVAYEKISDVKIVSTIVSPEIIRKSGLPVKVLEECLKRCQEDKVTTIESCGGFDFKPGQRRSSPYPKFTQGVSLFLFKLM